MNKKIIVYRLMIFMLLWCADYAYLSSQAIPALPPAPLAGTPAPAALPPLPDIPAPAQTSAALPPLPEAPVTGTLAPAQAPAALPPLPALPEAPLASAPAAPVPTALPLLPEVPAAPAMPGITPTPTPAPTSLPALPAAPLTETPAPAALPELPAPTTPATQPAQQTAVPQQDINHIASNIATIKTLKSQILDQLKDIDEKVYEARMLDAQAKKLSFSILKAPNQTEANKILNQVSEATRKVKTLEEKIKIDSAKNIDAHIAKIQDLMKSIEVGIAKLETQGVSFQAKELATLDKATPPLVKPAEKVLAPVVEKQQTPPAPVIEKSFLQHVADIFVNIIVGIIRAFGNIFSFFKNLIVPATQQPTQTPEQPLGQKGPTGLPVMPATTQPAAEDIKKKALESVDQAKVEQEVAQQLAQTEQVIKNLDQTQKQLVDKFEGIEKPLNTVIDRVSSNPSVQNILKAKAEEAPLIQPDSTFKKTAVAGFSTITDWFIMTVNAAAVHIKKAYHYISGRVEEKLEEAKNEEPAAEKPLESKTPLMPLSQPTVR